MKLKKFPILDNSMRCSFTDCPRQFYWWQLGFACETIPSYFSFGTAWGLLKQEWYSSKGNTKAPESEEWREIAKNAFSVALNHWKATVGARTDSPNPNNPETLMTLWNIYLTTYPNEDIEMIAPEVGFTFPLGTIEGIEVSIAGSLDGYVQQENIGVFALEEKTTGMWLNDSFISGYTYSPQITTYYWQGKKLIGEEFQGVLVNIAGKRIVSTRAKTPQFARTFQTRTEEELEEFERDFVCFVRDLYRAIDEDYFPRTTNHINCTGGIGRSPCLFRGLCASGIPYKDINPLVFPGIIKKENFAWQPWSITKESVIK